MYKVLLVDDEYMITEGLKKFSTKSSNQAKSWPTA